MTLQDELKYALRCDEITKISLSSQFLLESLFIYILKYVHLSKLDKKYFDPFGNGYGNFVGHLRVQIS